MAAKEDDVDAKNDENILYDLAVLAEWKSENEIFTRSQRKKSTSSRVLHLTSAAQRILWTLLRGLRLRPLEVAQYSLPEPPMSLVNTTLPWHLAISSSGSLAAVLQDECVEIRSHRDSFESVLGRGTVPKDPFPQWRCVVWSPDESMVACARSCGVVDVFDMVGSLLFSIQKPGSESTGLLQDMSGSVSALIFTDLQPEDRRWSAELLVIHHGGSLQGYLVDRDNGFVPRHTFLFTEEYPQGVTAAAYDAKHKVLFVGGEAMVGGEEGSISRREGLTAWRMLSDTPHYKLLHELDDEQLAVARRKSWLGKLKPSTLFSWSTHDADGIFRLCLSPDGQSLVGLHHSGRLSVWDVPSLRLRKSTLLEDQPYFDEVNATLSENPTKRKKIKDLIPHRKLVDVNFWSNQAIILARCSGAVTVSSLASLNNLLGSSPEWFEPSPRITEAHDGGFLGLECELQFPKQRILPTIEEDVDDSDDEDLSMVAMTTRATKQIMFYLTDSERFQPPKKKPKTVTKVYRMVWLKSTTPEELYARKIHGEEYGEALALAQAYNLDCDLVYQRQWRCSPASLASIQDYLNKISKRAWVLHECLERVPETLDAALELLQYGLRGTDLPALVAITSGDDGGRFMLCDPEEGLYEDADYDRFNPAEVQRYEDKKKAIRQEQLSHVDFTNLTVEQKEMCRARLKLLQYLDRLKTYEYILGGSSAAAERFSAEFYKEFRARNIVQIATEYAQCSDWKALEILFTYHYSELSLHRLAILSNFPETTWPGDYSCLLPEMGSDGEIYSLETDMWREEDWSELPKCQSVIQQDQEDHGTFLYEHCPQLLKFRVEELTSPLVQEWYEHRICEIEEHCRLVDHALEMTKLAIQKGFDGLGELLEDMITMETLVYECGVPSTLSFATLRDMSGYDRIELMMDKCPLDSYAKNARRWLVPVLQRYEARDPGAYRRLLQEFLLTRARTDLAIPLRIFQTSKAGVSNPIIPTTTDMMQFALDCLYSTERDDQLAVATEIFRCLPQKSQGDGAELVKLHKQVDRLERHLKAAQILQDNGIKKTLAFLKTSEEDSEQANKLFVFLTRSAGRKRPPLREAEWYKLHEDVLTLHDIVYRCLSPTLCHQIFVESLLCSNSLVNIRLAGDMMERQKHHAPAVGSGWGLAGGARWGRLKKLDYEMAVTLVLSAAREYFDSSSNLMHFCMDLAKSCLSLILDNPSSIQEELDLISSLVLLDDLSVSILPLQVRLCKDRLALVKQAVVSKPSNYKQLQKMLRLAHLLRVEAKDSAERDGKVMLLLVQAALAAGDITFAHGCCQKLVTASYGPAWTVCVDLAEQESFKDITAKVSLLSFAVTFCNADMIEPILQALSLLRRQILLEKVGHVLSQQTQGEREGTPTATSDQSGDTNTDTDPSIRQGSPFSAMAALQQTQAILSSTQRHTRAVLSSVTDTAWWRKAVHALHHPKSTAGGIGGNSKGGGDTISADFKNQGCHPFYEDVVENGCVDTSCIDYSQLMEKVPSNSCLSESVLRLARLEEMLTEGEKCDPAVEALLELGQQWLPKDTALGLAYLLSLTKVAEADKCLSNLPQSSGLALEIAQYYYAIQIYSALSPFPQPFLAPVYRHRPGRVTRLVIHHLMSHPEKVWGGEIGEAVPLLLQCQRSVEEWRQAQSLRRIAPSVDVGRFASDPEYKKETILGLAMSCEEEVYGMAVMLADRYKLPLWAVYMAHLEFLFSDSGLSTQDLKCRVDRLGMMKTLQQSPQDLCSRLYSHVYPSVCGTDHPRLLYLFSLLEGQDGSSPLCGLSASEHIRLLKKLRAIAPGIDYVKLMDNTTPPKDILAPYLTRTNINNVIKLAAKIPDKKGGFLHPSSLYCGWAVRVFWEGDKPGKAPPYNAAAWIHRYEMCGEYIQHLLPADFVTFLTYLTCSRDSNLKLEVSCRQEIVRRAIKFCHSMIGKKKKENEPEQEEEWKGAEQELLPLQRHLESLDSDTVKSFFLASDPKFQQYGQSYDLSCGHPHKVGQLLVLMVVEGQPLELVEDLLTVAPPVGLTVADVLRKALQRIIATLRGEEEEEEGQRKIYDPLDRLEKILENVQEHIESLGELAGRNDVFEVLHSYVSESSVSMKHRMAVLELLEKTVGLGAQHAAILLYCKTLRLVEPVWGEVELLEEQLNQEEGRLWLFRQLLATTSLASGYQALCQLLRLWPDFADKEDGESPWTQTLLAMASQSNPATVALIDSVLREMGTADFPLSLVDTKLVLDTLLRRQHPVEGVKVVLRSAHKKLYPSAILVLSAEEEVNDPDLIDLVLRRELTPQLVSTPLYRRVCQAVVAAHESQGLTAPPHLQLDTVVGQLQEAGLQVEAKALVHQAQATKPSLRSALGAVGSWFSKS